MQKDPSNTKKRLFFNFRSLGFFRKKSSFLLWVPLFLLCSSYFIVLEIHYRPTLKESLFLSILNPFEWEKETLSLRSESRTDHHMLIRGWDNSPESWGTWASAPRADIILRLSPVPKSDLLMTVFLGALDQAFLEVDVFVNEKFLEQWRFNYQEPSGEKVLLIPESVIDEKGYINISFRNRNSLLFQNEERARRQINKKNQLEHNNRIPTIGITNIKFGSPAIKP